MLSQVPPAWIATYGHHLPFAMRDQFSTFRPFMDRSSMPVSRCRLTG